MVGENLDFKCLKNKSRCKMVLGNLVFSHSISWKMRASWKNNLRNWWLEKQHWFEMCLKSEIKKGLKSTQHETLLFGIFHGPFDPDGFWWSPTLGVLPVFRIKRLGFAASAARNYWPKTQMRRQWRWRQPSKALGGTSCILISEHVLC